MGALSDMGGRREFFGPIVREPDEPVFHSRAEGRVFGIAGFVLVLVANLDRFRFAMEQLPREAYMSSYYQRMLGGCESLLVRAGYLGPDEVDARMQGRRVEPGRRRGSRVRLLIVSRVMRLVQRPAFPKWVAAYVLPRVFGASRPTLRRPRFAVGDRIRVRSEQARGHTRQPGYVTGKPGVITAHLGATQFPDARALGRRARLQHPLGRRARLQHSLGERARPQHLYTVAFEGSDLWGEQAEPGTEARVDLYEPYLEPA